MKEGILSLSVSRAGNNIFVDGLPGSMGSVHLVPSLTKEQRVADAGKNTYIEARTYRKGMKVWLRRLEDGVMLFCWLISSESAKIEYDPWQHLSPLNATA